MHRLAVAALTGAVVAGLAIPAAAASAAPAHVRVSVVRGNLNNPRHLTLTRDGLWVAQAGAGGPAGKSNCVTGPSIGGPGNTRYCVGETGAVSLIRHGHLSTAVRLPSVIEADTSEVAGPAAAAFGFGQSAVDHAGRPGQPPRGQLPSEPAGNLFGQL